MKSFKEYIIEQAGSGIARHWWDRSQPKSFPKKGKFKMAIDTSNIIAPSAGFIANFPYGEPNLDDVSILDAVTWYANGDWTQDMFLDYINNLGGDEEEESDDLGGDEEEESDDTLPNWVIDWIKDEPQNMPHILDGYMTSQGG